MRALALTLSLFAVMLVAAPAGAQQPAENQPQPQPAPGQPQPSQTAPHGGAEYGAEPAVLPRLTVPGDKAVLLPDGTAAAPALAPPQVQEAIWAANELQDKPYLYGGGHSEDFSGRGYDCSGTVSFALHAAGLLKRPRDSSSFMRYGAAGKGRWITIYTNPGHAYVIIAGLRLDTSSAGARIARARGPRWRDTARPMRGFKVRHPVGF